MTDLLSMKRRGLVSVAASVLTAAVIGQWQTAIGDERPDFEKFAVSQLDRPLEMDCATKHGKYLDAAKEFQLASISGEGNGDSSHRQAQSRLSYSKRLVHYEIPQATLTDTQSETVDFARLLDSDTPVMLNFIFTTCTTICPVLSASFEQVQELLGDRAAEVLMISVTIDPEYDTPGKLADYARRFEAGAQWKFLTGRLNEVVAVEKAFDIFRGSKTNHEPVTLLRAAGSAEWLRIEGFANAGEIVKEFEKLTDRDG